MPTDPGPDASINGDGSRKSPLSTAPDSTIIQEPPEQSVLEELLEALLDDQQQRWEQGQPIRVEDYLRRHPPLEADAECAAVLVYGEFLLRRQTGESVSFDDYLERFPLYADALQGLHDADHLLEPTLAVRFTDAGAAQAVSFGDYDLFEEIGRGGMGVVYRACQRSLGRTVALKMILAEQLAGEREIERFLNEAKAAAQLQHAHIVRIHEVSRHSGRHYFTMDYIEGVNLAERIQRNAMTATQAAQHLRTIALAVHHAHQRGVLHRDLKPSNILIDAAEQVHVTDFGLAQRMESDHRLTMTGQLLGTPSYMPPEQAQGQLDALGPPSDVYSLGAILYEMLTGRPPFRGSTSLDTLHQVINDDPVAPRVLSKQTPRDLETICLKCLHKQPSRRYASAQDLADDLERFLSGKPIVARPVSGLESAWKWVGRHPAAATVSALLLAFVIAALVFGYHHLKQEERFHLQEQRVQSEQEIAAVHQYHSLINRATTLLSEHASHARVGQILGAQRLLEEAACLHTPARDVVQLRSLASHCFGAVDLREQAVLAKGMQAYCVAFSSDSRRLAVGQELASLQCVVLVHDADGGELLRKLEFLVSPAGSRINGVRLLAFSPDGRWLVGGLRSGELLLWDTTNDYHLRRLSSAHKESIKGLAFSPDSRLLVSASFDQTLKVWDCCSWSELACHRFDQRLESASFSADGRYVVCTSPGWLKRLDAARLLQGSSSPVTATVDGIYCQTAFSPDGRMLLLDRNERPGILRHAIDLGRFQPLASGSQLDHDKSLYTLSLGGNGGLLATAAYDRCVKLSEVGSGRLLASLTVPGRGSLHAAVSPDGRRLAITADHQTILYEITGQQAETLVGYHPFPVQAMAFAPDGQSLACLAKQTNQASCELAFWPLAGDRPLQCQTASGQSEKVPPGREPSIAYHPDGVLLASSPDYLENVHVRWNRPAQAEGKSQLRLPDRVQAANHYCFSGDGKTLWAIVTGRHEVVSLNWPEFTERTFWSNTTAGNTSLLCLTAGRRWVLAGGRDMTAKLLRAQDGRLERSWPGPGGPVHSVALNAEETLAASGTQTGLVQIVRLPEGAKVQEWQAHHDAVEAVAFHPHETLLATGARDRTVRFWQQTGEAWIEVLTLSFAAPVLQLQFSADGETLAVRVQRERSVRLWHLDRLQARLKTMGIGW